METKLTEKRNHPRIETQNIVTYFLYDEKGKKVDEGKGFTKNLSLSGVLLVTDKPLPGLYIILMTIDLMGNKVKVSGTVAHTRKNSNSKLYFSGIKFSGNEEQSREAIVVFVKVYQHRRHMDQQK
ncbi:MAG: PilZ domain-containing protein [Desulfobacterales bacterium]|jgi:c-di-GMP-binding flagellar brake protein YcgR|nr:PilZ domain-containing protein [Desulfobacterales bacterium]